MQCSDSFHDWRTDCAVTRINDAEQRLDDVQECRCRCCRCCGDGACCNRAGDCHCDWRPWNLITCDRGPMIKCWAFCWVGLGVCCHWASGPCIKCLPAHSARYSNTVLAAQALQRSPSIGKSLMMSADPDDAARIRLMASILAVSTEHYVVLRRNDELKSVEWGYVRSNSDIDTLYVMSARVQILSGPDLRLWELHRDHATKRGQPIRFCPIAATAHTPEIAAREDRRSKRKAKKQRAGERKGQEFVLDSGIVGWQDFDHATSTDICQVYDPWSNRTLMISDIRLHNFRLRTADCGRRGAATSVRVPGGVHGPRALSLVRRRKPADLRRRSSRLRAPDRVCNAGCDHAGDATRLARTRQCRARHRRETSRVIGRCGARLGVERASSRRGCSAT